jgi:small-conductance mechanosensitive channel
LTGAYDLNNFSQYFLKVLSETPGLKNQILLSVLVILLAFLLRRIVIGLINQKIDDISLQYKWRKTSVYATVIMVFLFLGMVWFETLQSIGTFLGLVSAGVAIALKEIVANFAGWIFILLRKPLSVGDRVEIGEYKGDVIDIRIFEFSILEIGNWVDSDQSTGRVIHIPNGLVLSRPVANYDKGFAYIWCEIPVLVTFESDWEKAKEILLDTANGHWKNISEDAKKAVKKAAQQYLIIYSKLTPIVYTSARDSGVMLTIRYLCKPRQRRGMEENIWESILREFAKHPDIELAYPTVRYFKGEELGPDTRV